MKRSSVQNSSRRVALLLLVILCSVSSSFAVPHKAHAQLVVHDPFNGVLNTITSGATLADKIKGYSLDPIAWAVAKAALQSVVNSTVKWINSGFNGSPAFATNLSSTLQSVGDAAANSFIQQLQTNSAIKSPFQTQVASAVSTNYLQSTGSNGFFNANPFTLSNVSSNPTAFLAGNFSQGGLDAWFAAALPQNNSYGAYQLANGALSGQVAGAKSLQQQEYLAGSGFLSWRGNCQTTTTGQTTSAGTTGTSLSANSGCQSQNIITPGSVIANSLYKSLGSGIDTLVTASQFNELVSALMGQLLNHVLGGGGLAGLSQPSSSTGGVAYFDQTTTASTSSTSLTSSFTQTITQQITQLQTFESEWNTINAAAQGAESALQTSTCSPNAQSIISTTIQPVINEATTELATAQTSITDLNTIQNELPASNSTAATTAQLSQASTDYSNLISSGTLPSDSDFSTAASQSIDTGTTTPVSLYTQMNQIAQAARTCAGH
jgi:hypothetical protein